MNFLRISHKHRLYLIHMLHFVEHLGLPTSNRLVVLPSRGIVVEVPPVRGLPADYPFFQRLGFNLAPYNKFFLLSRLSRLHLFHRYVVVLLSLGYSSNSGSRGGLQVLTTHKFLYALTLLPLISPQLKLGVYAAFDKRDNVFFPI